MSNPHTASTTSSAKTGSGGQGKASNPGQKPPFENQENLDTESEFTVMDALRRSGGEDKAVQQSQSPAPAQKQESTDTESEFSVSDARRDKQ